RDLLGDGILDEILRGGSDVTRSIGVPTLGGHSIDDAEPKYGLVAVGEVHPGRMVTNAGAKPGDVLVLTKPLGSGVIATAIKQGEAPDDVITTAVEVMVTLNAGAAEAMRNAGVISGTDVTGFGLLGHLHNLLRASGVAATLRSSDVPLISGARELVEAGHVPGGTKRNLEDLAESVSFADSVDDFSRTLLGDAQTSGGLLMCVSPDAVDALLLDLEGRSPVAAVIGEVVAGTAGRISVE
ncbi:MAG TPA: selenide, water dikinase SelD, partial [Gemmatimonadetes bacterium]|nr:selenide, water dikinase SelD [Gemmatimonadota bacterium]